MVARGRGRPTGNSEVVATEAVLDAALDAFAERGFEATSVREIARSLGVSHNLIPQRIGSKDDLWLAAVERGFGQLAVALAGAVQETEDADDLARLRAMVLRFVEANAARPALLRILNREAVTGGPRFDVLWERYIEPVRHASADLLERLEAAGVVRTGSVALVYFFMTHGAGGPAALPALAGRFDDAVDPAVAVELLFEGLQR